VGEWIREERRQAVLRTIGGRDFTRTDDLANALCVSIETARRDLVALERQGLVRRVHGGVQRVPGRSWEPEVPERRLKSREAKQAMAALTVELLVDVETVVLDIGTSVAEVARQLGNRFRGRVLTNSLPVAAELDGYPDIEVVVSGGQMRRGDMALYGPEAQRFFASFYADVAILGSGGVHPDIGLTDYYPAEVAVRQIILEHATESYVLADASKIGQVAVSKVCELERLTGLITDPGAENSMVEQIMATDIKVMIADTGVASVSTISGTKVGE